jgi:hypothetical protein
VIGIEEAHTLPQVIGLQRVSNRGESWDRGM